MQLLQRYQHQVKRISLSPVLEVPPIQVRPDLPANTVVATQMPASTVKTSAAQKQFIYKDCQHLSQLVKIRELAAKAKS